MNFPASTIDAKSFETSELNYDTRFVTIYEKISKCYEILKDDDITLPKDENDISDILVENYLKKHIKDYTFEREKYNEHGRIDIFIVEKIEKPTAPFIIECKLLNKTNTTGTTGNNAKYIKDGIYRFIVEYYSMGLDENYFINGMIGFVVEKLDIHQSIDDLNKLSKILFNNLVEIDQQITLESKNIYKSIYTSCTKKQFTVYHLMMDLSSLVNKTS